MVGRSPEFCILVPCGNVPDVRFLRFFDVLSGPEGSNESGMAFRGLKECNVDV